MDVKITIKSNFYPCTHAGFPCRDVCATARLPGVVAFPAVRAAAGSPVLETSPQSQVSHCPDLSAHILTLSLGSTHLLPAQLTSHLGRGRGCGAMGAEHPGAQPHTLASHLGFWALQEILRCFLFHAPLPVLSWAATGNSQKHFPGDGVTNEGDRPSCLPDPIGSHPADVLTGVLVICGVLGTHAGDKSPSEPLGGSQGTAEKLDSRIGALNSEWAAPDLQPRHADCPTFRRDDPPHTIQRQVGGGHGSEPQGRPVGAGGAREETRDEV